MDPVPKTTFFEAKIEERSGLQNLIKNQITIFSDDLLVIAEEYSDWEDSKRRIDLLCLNKDRSITVIELKRTEDGGHMELQALRYAAMVSSMRLDQAISAYERYLTEKGEDSSRAQKIIEEFINQGDDNGIELTGHVKIILASANFSSEIATTVLWLNNNYGLDITCFRLIPYALGDKTLLDAEQIIPLPEAKNYTTKIRDQRAAQDSSRNVIQYKFTEFWDGLIKYCSEHNSTLYPPRKSTYKPYIVSSAAFPSGLSLSCYIKKNTSRVYLYIYTPSQDRNKSIFNQYYNQRETITKMLGFELEWKEMPNNIASNIFVENQIGLECSEADRISAYAWILDTSNKMHNVFKTITLT